MEQFQFDILLETLIMIEQNTRKEKEEISPDESDVLKRVRSYFYDGLGTKTGWGRNELKELFEDVLERVKIGPKLSTTPIEHNKCPF